MGKDRDINLDPEDWDAFRDVAHHALDAMITHLQTTRDRPVWISPPDHVRAELNDALPRTERALAAVLNDFDRLIKPYTTGNTHPAFMGWVHGAGTPAGMVAEMLAAGLNANCGGRNHIAIDVERQITRWMAEAFDFPQDASGIFVTGTSMANFLGLLIARTHSLGVSTRRAGIKEGPQLCAYASQAAHGCVVQAMALSGIGADYLRLTPCNPDGGLNVSALQSLIEADKADGLRPFLIVGTAGSVDTGAIDPLSAIADLAQDQKLWFHVDGAFGALCVLSERLRHRVAGIERADSIAFDFHKWAHVPYDAGFLIVRDSDAHRRTFASPANYLTRAPKGLAAGDSWPSDFGLDLSRGFKALKTWFTLQTFGADRIGQCIYQTCEIARYLERCLHECSQYELSAPVTLNIVCFSVKGENADQANRNIVEHLHLTGRAAPSITIFRGLATIRCAIVNHRTTQADIDVFMTDLAEARIATK